MARFRMQVCFFFFSFLFYSLSEGLNSLHLFPSSRILYVSWIYLFSNIYNLLLFYQLIKFVNLKIDGFCVGLFCFALLYFLFRILRPNEICNYIYIYIWAACRMYIYVKCIFGCIVLSFVEWLVLDTTQFSSKYITVSPSNLFPCFFFVSYAPIFDVWMGEQFACLILLLTGFCLSQIITI